MRACDKCLENNWEYKCVDLWIIATCQNCGYEVQFKSRKLRKQKNG